MDVRDEPDQHRFVVEVDGSVAGVAEYELREGRYVFTRTVVEDEYEGQGVGSTLARSALDQLRDRGVAVVPLCPFIAAWIEGHDEYADLVDQDLLAELRDDA